MFLRKIEQAEDIDEDFTKKVFKEIQKETGIKGKNLFMPIRILISGKTHGPELAKLMMFLDKEKILKRLDYAKNNFINLDSKRD